MASCRDQSRRFASSNSTRTRPSLARSSLAASNPHDGIGTQLSRGHRPARRGAGHSAIGQRQTLAGRGHPTGQAILARPETEKYMRNRKRTAQVVHPSMGASRIARTRVCEEPGGRAAVLYSACFAGDMPLERDPHRIGTGFALQRMGGGCLNQGLNGAAGRYEEVMVIEVDSGAVPCAVGSDAVRRLRWPRRASPNRP